jgi:catechol 2,3-dioxygenase-like lactoylglutathione lyase family enzyme
MRLTKIKERSVMIKGIGHAAFTVSNMEKSLHFYCDVLGFKKAFELAEPATGAPWIVYLEVVKGQFVELFYGGTKSAPWEAAVIGYNHLCLEVDDIQAAAAGIRSKGWVLDREPKRGVDHNWQCWVRDPDGNRIEFMQMDPKSPHMNY